MSNDYKKAYEKDPTISMREWSKRPGKMDLDGNPIYRTEQAHKKECDVNEIIRKYDRNGLITHVSKIEAKFGDMTGLDFQDMHNKIINAINMFNELPSQIRNKFDNSPAQLLSFMDNPDNRDKAIEMGLIKAEWKPEEDGIGEHVVRDEDGIVKEPPA